MDYKIKKSFFLLVLGVGGVLLVSLLFLRQEETETEFSGKVTQLQMINSFPELEQRPYLSQGIQIEIDEDSFIYILDPENHKIYKLDNQGNLENEIGKEGRGPGEFLGGGNGMSLEGDTLFVNDGPNARFVLFNRNGESLTTRRREETSIFFNTTHRGKIFGQTLGPDFRNEEEGSLVKIYNTQGKQIGELGEYKSIDGFGYVPSLANFAYVNIYNNYIYVSYAYFPTVEVYNMDFEMVNSFSLDDTDYMQRVAVNYESETYEPFNAPSMKLLLTGQVIVDDHLFLGIHDEDLIIIDRFDLDGNFLERYTYEEEEEEDFYVRDFAVEKKEEQYVFYILSRNEHFKVKVLEQP